MQMMHFVDKNNPENIIDAATRKQKERAAGQFSMFDMFSDIDGSGFQESIPAPDGIEWDRRIKLAQEHEVLGIYVSDHPLRPYEYALSKQRDYTISDIAVSEEYVDPTGGVHERFKVPEGKLVRFAGMVTGIQKKTTKNGDPMAIVTLEDMEGEITLVVFPKVYRQCASTLTGEVDPETGESSGDIFISAKGRLERSDRGDQLMCAEITKLDLDERSNRPKVLEINLPANLLSRTRMDALVGVLGHYAGLDHVELRVESAEGNTLRMELPTRVDARNMVLLAEVTDLVGREGQVVVA